MNQISQNAKTKQSITQKIGLSLLLLTSLTSQTFAEDKSNEIIVSASRIPIDSKKVGNSVTVLNEIDFKRTQAITVADILRQTPGLSVNQTGGQGGLTQIRIRGTEADHTLVIMDGIELNDPSSSSDFNFNTLLLDDIQKIEIIRGAQSAIWGSDAIGGVIVITTKSGDNAKSNQANTYRLLVESGSFGTHKANMQVTGKHKAFSYFLSSTRFLTDGYSATNEERGATEPDGQSSKTIHLNVSYKISNNSKLKLVYRQTDAVSDSDGFSFGIGVVDNSLNYIETSERYSVLQYNYNTSDKKLTYRIRYANTKKESDFFFPGQSNSDGRKQKVDMQIGYNLESSNKFSNKVVFALESERDELNASYNTGLIETNSVSLISEFHLDYNGRFFTIFGLRSDDNDRFKDKITARLSSAYLINPSSKLHASLGSGIKNPTLFDLFGSTAFFTGNPDILPEETLGWDIGFEKKFSNGKTKIDITLFNTDIKNLIKFANSTVENVAGKSKSKGVEFSLNTALGSRWNMTASYTYLDAQTAERIQQIRRPKHKSTLNLNFQATVNLNFNLELIDSRGAVDFNNSILVKLDNYLLTNLTSSYKINKKMDIYFRAHNIFNDQYEEVFRYGTANRSGSIGLRIRM